MSEIRLSATPSASDDTNVYRSLMKYLQSTPAHGSTTDAVTDALREAILDGALPPSTWLREDELAHWLKVSRTPVREALRRLGDERLTVRVAHRGTAVASMTMDDVLAVYMVRESLEGLAARMTAMRQSPHVIELLTDVHRRMEAAAAAGEIDELAHLHLEFHRTLREGSTNPYLDRFLTQVEHAVRRFGQTTFHSPTRTDEVLAEHRAIIEAIVASDPERAAAAAEQHMRRAREVRIQSMLGF